MARLKKPLLIFLRYYRNLGLRVTLYALLSLVAAFASPFVGVYLDDETVQRLDFTSVTPVLTILATSMLAVSTFSLNIMVSAHRAAADTTTPRVHQILLEDTTTQSVLSTFIGAFVYAFAAIVLFQSGFYSDEAAIVVMGVTIVVAVLVVIAMLRWVQYLTNLGSVDDSLASAETKAREALRGTAEAPAFGANPIGDDTVVPVSVTPIPAPSSGYLQLIDVGHLEECRPDNGLVYVLHLPGTHVLAGEAVAQVTGQASRDARERLAAAFTIGPRRTYEQDAAYGLTVLSEIASKALSPGINDPGTAIEAIVRLKALLWAYAQDVSAETADIAPHVFIPTRAADHLVKAAYAPIARDGAGVIEVAEHLQRALDALAQAEDAGIRQAAAEMSALAYEYSEQAGLLAREVTQLQKMAETARAGAE
ncbi:MAG: DUF2254 domain-containing protein [Pseudomonadota bacterium]